MFLILEVGLFFQCTHTHVFISLAQSTMNSGGAKGRVETFLIKIVWPVELMGVVTVGLLHFD